MPHGQDKDKLGAAQNIPEGRPSTSNLRGRGPDSVSGTPGVVPTLCDQMLVYCPFTDSIRETQKPSTEAQTPRAHGTDVMSRGRAHGQGLLMG